jgi:hypothetical protein
LIELNIGLKNKSGGITKLENVLKQDNYISKNSG